MRMYEEEGNPATLRDGDLKDDGLKAKQIAGEPASKQRAWVRRQCRPRGPVGHLLESIHMQAVSIDEEGTVWQNDQIPTQLLKAAYQQVAGMLETMATRNRTMAAANLREECEGLSEIDRGATKGNDKRLTPQELTNLNMPRPISLGS